MAKSALNISIDRETMRAVERSLLTVKNGYETVTARAINGTVKTTRTLSAKLIKQEVNLTAKVIKEAFKPSRLARKTDLSGAVVATSRPVPLIDFGAKQEAAGVSIKIWRNGPRETIKKAFIATMKSGHRGVFQRKSVMRSFPGQVPIIRRRVSTGDIGAQYARLSHDYRLPIKELFSTRITDVFTKQAIMEAVLQYAGEDINERMANELERLLAQAR
jgi:hypothetical protein